MSCKFNLKMSIVVTSFSHVGFFWIKPNTTYILNALRNKNVEARFHQQLSSKQVRYVREVFLDEVSKLRKVDHVLGVAG
jgi:hypothetical protein